MKALIRTWFYILIGLLVTGGAGCGNKFFDPAQIGRFRPTPAVNIILDSLGVAEESPSPWEDATEPLPEDVLTSDHDYRLGSGDVVRIAIYELLMEGRMETRDYVINESGKLSVPDVGIIQASGLSETALEQSIRDILSPNILANPTVSVTLINSQQRLCSVVGEGVARPGRFVIPRHNFRLADALAVAGGANQFNVTNIYVSRAPRSDAGETLARSTFGGQRIPQPLATVGPTPIDATMSEFGGLPPVSRAPQQARPTFQRERQMLGMETSMTQRLWSESEKVISARSNLPSQTYGEVISPASFAPAPGYHSLVPGMAARGVTALAPLQGSAGATPNPQLEWVFENGKWTPVTRGATSVAPPTSVPRTPSSAPSIPRSAPTGPAAVPTQPSRGLSNPGDAPQIEWVFQEGRWVPVQGRSLQPDTPAYEFGQDPSVLPLNGRTPGMDDGWETVEETRLIQIPKDRLMAGDQKYNIVIKPGDTIYVPVDVVGEFYIMGNVNRTGTINMTGRPVTLKMAVAMAGGLGPLAYPKKCEITRRIDTNREETVLVDLDKIASGEQPDFFIKPNDTINVGTHYSSRWRAVLRNSFRAAWGFGMVYDRNFADDQFGSGFPSWVPFL